MPVEGDTPRGIGFDGIADTKLTLRLVGKIEAFLDTPRPPGCKKLQAFRDLWRIRVGDYRIVYAIDDEAKRIDIMRIAHRSEVYE